MRCKYISYLAGVIQAAYHIFSGIVISQSIRGGFRFRTVDEIAEKRHEFMEHPTDGRLSPSPLHQESSVDEKKISEEYIDRV